MLMQDGSVVQWNVGVKDAKSRQKDRGRGARSGDWELISLSGGTERVWVWESSGLDLSLLLGLRREIPRCAAGRMWHKVGRDKAGDDGKRLWFHEAGRRRGQPRRGEV